MAKEQPDVCGLNRRQWLKTTAAGTTFLLAGCSGGDQSEDGTTTSEQTTATSGETQTTEESQSREPVDSTFDTTIQSIPTQQNFNVFATSNSVFIDVRNLMHSWIGVYLPYNNEVQGLLAEDWNLGTDTVTITLRDDITWHNGEPVTARDYIVTKKMYQLMRGNSDPLFTDYEAVDDKTVEFSVNTDGDLNPGLLKLELFARQSQNQFNCPESVYGDLLQKLEDAESEGEEALEEARKEVSETRIDEPVGAGPLKVDSIDQQKMTLVPHDGNPGGRELNFETYRLHYVENEGQMNRGMINDEYDALKNATGKEQIRNQFPDSTEYVEKPTYSGKGMLLNQDSDLFADWRVRRAIAHAIDPTRFSDRFSNQLSIEPTYFGGVSRFAVDEWIPEDLGQTFNDYSGHDQSEAESLLEEAGFEKSGDSWMRPNGDEFSFTLKVGSADQGTFASQMIKEDLEQLGITVETTVAENATVYGQVREGNYEAAVWGWGALNVAHPYQDMWEMYSPDGWWYGQCNQTGTVEAPPVGEPDGSLQEFDVEERIKAARTADDDEMKSIVQELAWVFNQTTPIVELGENGPEAAMRTDNWEAPLDEPMANIFPPHFIFSQTGDLQARTE